MAITNNGTKNSIPADHLPSGYTRPSITEFTDWKYKRRVTLNVAKATVQNATAATTMTNIIGNGTVGVTKQVDDILAADFLGSATITAFADIVSIQTNITDLGGASALWTNAAVNYVCIVDIYVKST